MAVAHYAPDLLSDDERTAAIVLFLHGKADSSFDMAQRPFFLTFNTPDRNERTRAFRELCRKTGLDPEPYMRQLAVDEKERSWPTELF